MPFLWIGLDLAREYFPVAGPYVTAIYVQLVAASDKDGKSFPSWKTLGALAGCSDRQARRAVNQLIEAGLVATSPRIGADGRQTSNLFTLTDPTPEQRAKWRVDSQTTLATDDEGGQADTPPRYPDSPPKEDVVIELDHSPKGLAASAARPRSLRDQFELDYKASERQQDRMAVLGRLFTAVTAAEPDYARIGKLARDLNSGYDLGILILNMASADIGDDPHDYLQAMVQTRKTGRRERRQPQTSAPEPFNPERYRREREQGGKR